jgi:hypothetical protein
MGWPTSQRFRETVTGSHQAVVRLTLLRTVQFGSAPRTTSPAGTWWDLPLRDDATGNAILNATSSVTGSLSITVPGEWWDQVQPYGVEVFAERGVAFGDGTAELVPVGYFRVDEVDQESAPFGPITLSCSDRTAQLGQLRVALPWQIPVGTSHQAIFRRLLDGSAADGIGGYGMYGPAGPAVPVVWTGAGYDPVTTVTTKVLTVEEGVGDFLSKLVAERGAVIRARATGDLAVVAKEPASTDTPDYTLMDGKTGTLVQASRRVTRDGVFNIVRATGSDTAFPTGYRLAYNNDPTSPIRYDGPFGPVVRYYASPVLKDSEGADKAAETILAGSTGLPQELSLWTVPDPSVRPLDLVEVVLPTGVSTHVVDEVSIPLAGTEAVTIRTRTLNVVLDNPSDPEPDPGTLPDPDDPGTPDPGTPEQPGQGSGGDPSDGVQAAVARGWGAVVAGDECNGTGRPTSDKWGLYDGVGHDGNGRRVPSAWNYHDGMLTIKGDQGGNTGGAAFRYSGMGYRVEVRARAYRTGGGGGSDYHFVLILWPDSDQWPQGAEYDFWEGDVNDKDATAFLHLPNHQPYRQDAAKIAYDPKDWHNYACEWNPSAQTLKVFVDNVQVYDGKGRVAQAPGPMHLTAQLDNFGGSNHYNANMDIAWVRIYKRPNA